jgi:hypothetical protein
VVSELSLETGKITTLPKGLSCGALCFCPKSLAHHGQHALLHKHGEPIFHITDNILLIGWH